MECEEHFSLSRESVSYLQLGSRLLIFRFNRVYFTNYSSSLTVYHLFQDKDAMKKALSENSVEGTLKKLQNENFELESR